MESKPVCGGRLLKQASPRYDDDDRQEHWSGVSGKSLPAACFPCVDRHAVLRGCSAFSTLPDVVCDPKTCTNELESLVRNVPLTCDLSLYVSQQYGCSRGMVLRVGYSRVQRGAHTSVSPRAGQPRIPTANHGVPPRYLLGITLHSGTTTLRTAAQIQGKTSGYSLRDVLKIEGGRTRTCFRVTSWRERPNRPDRRLNKHCGLVAAPRDV
ncbi:hypothetical protein Bbelb_237290 [Branchiostoma belcheri]|nr:hypothetical protein Bbelb_237290 [Branchiostoma belcheri]